MSIARACREGTEKGEAENKQSVRGMSKTTMGFERMIKEVKVLLNGQNGVMDSKME